MDGSLESDLCQFHYNSKQSPWLLRDSFHEQCKQTLHVSIRLPLGVYLEILVTLFV